jgi:hypothetical protein
VSRGSLRSRSRSPSPLRDASSPVGRLRRVKLPPSRERPLSPTREELVLLSTPHRQQHRRRRRTPPAGRLEPLYVADQNEPPELAAIRRDRAVKGAPGLYGAPADQEIVQPPRIPSPTHDVENEPSVREGRRKKKKKRARSRSREPVKPTQTVDAWAGARPAYYSQLTSIEHVRDSLPISFLIETGQHKEVLRRRLSYALSIYRRERIHNYRLIWDRWVHGVKFLRSQEFVAKVIVKARHDAINRWYRVLEMSCDLACQRRIRLWYKHMILLRRAERRRIRHAAARVLQKFVRQTLARWAGRRLLFKLRRRREHADACALLTIATFQRQQFRAARLIRSRTLADRSYTNACVIQHRVRLRLARIELARRIRQKQLDREAAAGLTLGKFMHFLKADKSRSNRMSANLVRWREKKLMSKKGALTHEEIQERQAKIDELHAQIAERRRRALELREAKSRELDRMRLVRKDAARAAAAGDGFDEAALAGGDLAAAAEQAELEELRRLEAMLAHEEEMRRSARGVPYGAFIRCDSYHGVGGFFFEFEAVPRRLRAEYSPPPPPPLTKPVFVDHSDTSITIKADGGQDIKLEYHKVGSITHTIDATLLPFFGGQTTITGLEPASQYIFRLTRGDERGPVLTAATHQAPEVCAVLLQKRVRTWNMRQILVLKRKAREAYLALFYDKCDLLTEMISAAVIIKTYRKVLLWRDWKSAESASADAVALLAKNYLFMLLSDEHKAKSVTRDAAARYEQRIWRDRMRRRLDWHDRTALKIQITTYMWLARIKVQCVRDEHDAFVRRTSAADVIRHVWHRTLQRRVLALRFDANDLEHRSKAQTCAMNAAVCLLRRALERKRTQRYIERRIAGTRALKQVERRRQRRHDAVALISKNYRRHWDRKNTYLRLVAYVQRRNVKKRHAKRDRMSRLVAKHWFAMQWRYNQPLRIIARRRVENNEKMCAEVVEQVRRDDAALVFRRAIRRWLDWKYLCRRFDAQRERLDLEETLRTRLESAECIQRNWLAYLERCAERARVLALRDRDARREELELQEDAAFQIQRCVQCYLFNRLLELRFQAAAQRLDAEREQRRRVDAARHERRDAEKAQELAEQALKQVELSSWKMGADEEGSNYYYNWVTGESSYEKPEGWYPPAEEVRLRRP